MGCSQMKKQEKLVQEVEYQLLDTIGRVKKIEEYKHEIESFKEKWKMSERDSFESAEGGEIRCFYIEKDTVKKEIDYYGEMGRKHLVLYQKNGLPVLMEEKIFVYEEPLGINQTTALSDSLVQQFYFDKQNLIYWLKNGQHVHSSSYKEKEEELLVFF
ncbi:hypothetical protein HX004_08390 [Myroides sp. 1354]|nr:hypothetical protein [Myroides sp. R163-1]MDM1055789.1 hypothetical protein [Myroides sp. 1354]MDM1069970.1 hypothetical protein [Myroides sp. 1372]